MLATLTIYALCTGAISLGAVSVIVAFLEEFDPT